MHLRAVWLQFQRYFNWITSVDKKLLGVLKSVWNQNILRFPIFCGIYDAACWETETDFFGESLKHLQWLLIKWNIFHYNRHNIDVINMLGQICFDVFCFVHKTQMSRSHTDTSAGVLTEIETSRFQSINSGQVNFNQ